MSEALHLATIRKELVEHATELSGERNKIHPRIYARSSEMRAIYEAVYSLDPGKLQLLHSAGLRMKCFSFSAASYYRTSLIRCVRSTDVRLILNTIGEKALEHGIFASKQSDGKASYCEEVYSGDELVDRLEKAIQSSKLIWFSTLPTNLQSSDLIEEEPTIHLETDENDLNTATPCGLTDCLQSEILRLTTMGENNIDQI